MSTDRGEPRPEARLVPFGSVERTRAGAPWWMYRRPRMPPPEWETRAAEARPAPSREEPVPPALQGEQQADVPSAAPALAVAAALLLFLLANGHWFMQPRWSRVLVPMFGLAATVGAAWWLARRHQDEPWLPRLLILGVVVKLIGCALRYRTFADAGDAPNYDKFGRRYANFWLHKAGAISPDLDDLRKSNFVRWFTGVVYYLFGSDMIAGYFVFGLIAFVGAYLWYRATAEALPFLDKRLYLILVMFVPSIAFWPSSIGKEALMQFGIGAAALGTAFLLRNQVVRGLLIALPGAWLLWVVRPHLLALVTLAAAAAYAVGRTRRGANESGSIFKPLGLVALGFLVVFSVSQGAKSLGLPTLSLQSVEAELNATTESTRQGSGAFDPGTNSLSPLRLPEGAMTVLLRPLPFEVSTNLQILASLEGVALAAFIVHRRSSVALSLRRIHSSPFLFYCWTLTLLYAMSFQAFANFGLLVRQRSLVLPALYVLLCLDPARARALDASDAVSSRRALPAARRGS
jgi:hypothetical protein